MASARVKWPSLAWGWAAFFFGVASMRAEGASCSEMSVCPLFLWLSVSRRLLEFAVHHHPGFTADNNVVPLTCNMRSRLYLILRCEPGERAITGGVAFGVARRRPRY